MNIGRLIALNLAAVLVAVGAAPAVAQEVKVEKYTLDNGMTVILHEDHSLPLAVVNIWYRVGALDEPPGRSGFAHLFEHLMFMGTKRVQGNDFDVLMETGGGANNASTDLYRTNYYSWGPATLLPTLLWLDADRLEDMGLNMTQEKLDKQRDIVRNELRQTIENTPYGKAGEMVFRLMFPPGHPYHNSVAGTHEDLEAATVDNVRDFFANFYTPANASLVVAGDFDPATIKPLVARLFGTLPRGGPVQRRTPAPVKLDRVVRATTIDKVQLPKILMSWHSPVAYTEGDAELRLAAAVLGDGKTSRLYKRLVMDDKSCVDVSVAQNSSQLQSLFQIDVTTRPGADLDKVEAAIDEEVTKLAASGPTAEELTPRQAEIELGMVSGLQKLLAKADGLNEYEYFLGQPDSFKRDLERYRGVTAEGVKRWTAQTLDPKARSIIRVLPEEPERPESPRDQRPADAAAKAFAPPAPAMFTLSNGLPVMVWTRSDLPLVAMRLVARTEGFGFPAQPGLAGLSAEMLGEGAGERDALAFEQAVQSLGASFGAGADQERLDVSLTVIKRNFEKALALFADAIRRPRFDEKEWDRVKSLHLENLAQELENPSVVADHVAERLLFGDRNPYAWPAEGTIDSVKALDLAAIKAAYGALLRPDKATLLVAGDVSADEAKAALEKALGDWKPTGPAAAAAADFAASQPDGLRVFLVHRPEAVQTVVRFEMPGVKFADEKRVPLRLLNTILGGSFTSRLNQNLREDHGYTYGARSRFEMNPSAGAFYAGAAVKADVTGAALREFLSELKRIRAGDITDAEAAKAREQFRYEAVDAFAGRGDLLGQAAQLAMSGLPFETFAADYAAASNVTAAELNALAKTSIPLDQAVLVLVGDRGVILDQVKDLGLPAPQEVDATGRAVGPPQ